MGHAPGSDASAAAGSAGLALRRPRRLKVEAESARGRSAVARTRRPQTSRGRKQQAVLTDTHWRETGEV